MKKPSNDINRIAMSVSYRGTPYQGWQKQAHSKNTVQEYVEYALSKVANAQISTFCAGRTDTGVHGTGQIIHFDTSATRDNYSWRMGVNTYLPRDIRINWVTQVDSSFHARFSALSRRYNYIIEDDSVGNAIVHGLITPYRYKLESTLMHQAAQCLTGEQDFSSFRAAQCQSKSPYRHIDHINVTRNEQFIVIDIQANAFLYHMVRNIVGSLLLIGQKKQQPSWLADIIHAKDRTKAPATAPPHGLYLVEVRYPETFDLPPYIQNLPFLSL